MIALASKTKKILLRQPKIRLVAAAAIGFGDQIATLRIINWLRAAGFGGWIELIINDQTKFKVEELLNLPHNLPTTFVNEETKISLMTFTDFYLYRDAGEIDCYLTTIRSLLASKVFSPMPATSMMSSGALKGPFSFR